MTSFLLLPLYLEFGLVEDFCSETSNPYKAIVVFEVLSCTLVPHINN